MAKGIQKRVAKDGTIAYRVRLQPRGRPALSATFSRMADALAWQVTQQKTLLDQQRFPGRQASDRTLGAVIARYEAEVLPHKSPHFQREQRGQLRWWSHHLGALRVAELSPHHLTAARDLLHARLGPGSVNRYLAALSHVCTIALKEWEWLDYHPLHRVRRLREPRGRVRYLDANELPALLTACQQSGNPYLSTLVVLALTTGARKMELLGLRWQDVDMERHQLTFHDRKNHQRHTVPLVGDAREQMQALAREQTLSSPWVFPGRDGAKPRDIRRAWEGARTRAGLVDFRFHDLRHTAASYLAMSGATLVEIADVLGHTNIAQTKRYSHLSEAHTTRVVERMATQFLSGAV